MKKFLNKKSVIVITILLIITLITLIINYDKYPTGSQLLNLT